MKKHLLLFLTLFVWAGTASGQTTVNFDTPGNWTQDGATALTSYGNHSYAESGLSVQLTNGLRNGTTAQDGFAGALGTYSIRLKNTADSKAALTISTGGVSNFSFKVRQWDNNPAPNYTVKYSINGGTNWTSLTNIDATLLTTSDFFTYSSGTINSSVSNFLIEVQNTGTTERIMIDDFTWNGYAAPTTVTIANTGTPTAGDIAQNTSDAVLFGFSLTPSASVDFTAVSIATSGSATTDDISNFRLVLDVNNDGAFDGGDTVVDTVATLANPLVFNSFSSAQDGLTGLTRYLLIADVDVAATASRTFTASIAAAGDVTTTGDESGTATGNEQTIISASAPVITVTGALSAFESIAGANSSSQNYTVEGSNLTANITITAPTNFTVSTDDSSFLQSVELTQSGGTVNSTTIYARFSPSSANGSNPGDITHTSTDATTQNQAVSGFAYASEPTTAASSLSFTNVGETTFTINWTRGDGDSVLVVMKAGSAVTFDPSDKTTYSVNAAFGTSTLLGTASYGVYKGTGDSVAVTGLSASTTYHVEVFEFNVGSAALTHNYNVSSTLVGSQVTDSPDFTEGFDNYPETSVSYKSGSFSGINSSTWTYVDARGDQSITGKSPGLKNASTSKLNASFTGGISSFSFDYKKMFSTDVNLDVFINGDLVTTVTTSSSSVQNSGVISVNYIGTFTIEFKQNTSPTGGQVLVDNFSWSSKTGGTREITGTAGWRMLSAPITGFTVEDISDNTAIQGVTGGSNAGSTSNFYTYNSSGAFGSPANVSTTFGDGYGFITYFYNNTTGGSAVLPITLDVSGSEPSSDVEVSLNKTTTPKDNDSGNADDANYYTLVGNPFASNYTLSSLTNDGDGIGANISVWDNSITDYQTMPTISGIVAPWQGFWVAVAKTGTATKVTFPKTGKTASVSTATYFKTVAKELVEGQITLSHSEITSAPYKIQLMDEAVMGNDRNDLAKFTPLSESYATVAGRLGTSSLLHAIHALPSEIIEPVELAIEPMIAGNNGEFTLNWNKFNSFPEYLEVALFDSETGLTYNLREDGSITFTQIAKAKASENPLKSLTATASGSNRFKVHITPTTTAIEAGNSVPTQTSLAQNFPNPFNPSTTISFGLPTQSQVRLSVFDMLGREVSVLVNGVKAAGNYELSFDASRLSSGMYIYRLEANGSVLTKKMTLIK